MMDANEQRVDAESEDHDETEQMDQPSRVKIIALSGTVVEEARLRTAQVQCSRTCSKPERAKEMTMPVRQKRCCLCF